MTDAVPARMFARTPHYNNRAERQHSVVTLPLVAALVEPGSRYSLDDPRIGSQRRAGVPSLQRNRGTDRKKARTRGARRHEDGNAPPAWATRPGEASLQAR